MFKHLFNGKGRSPQSRRGLVYELEDFNATYFSGDWHVVFDKLGDGCKVDFPLRIENKLKWSSLVYNFDGSVKSRVFTEMISVTVVKSRC